MVEKRSNVPADKQRLIFAGKEFDETKGLQTYVDEYDLGNNSTIFMVLRLPGGSKSFGDAVRSFPVGVPRSSEDCSVCFSSGESMVMPCGHVICPSCLLEHAWDTVNCKNKTVIPCSVQECNAEWSLKVIKKFGNANKEEMKRFQEKLSENAINNDTGIWECPGCKNYCCRTSPFNNRIECTICTEMGKNPKSFCFRCHKTWKNTTSHTICGNSGCDDSSFLSILREAPLVTPSYLPTSIQTPSKRACVGCGLIIELAGQCKHMTCPCGTGFCFVCLEKKVGDSWKCGSYRDVCTPAPRQSQRPN